MRRIFQALAIAGLLATTTTTFVSAQADRWQQRAEYTMEVDFDVTTHRFQGAQKIVYHNNSPDTLWQVFYHLYFNAFQPGSMMDVRSRTIPDPDSRVGSRIEKLQAHEQGYHRILSLTQDGKKLDAVVVGTILEVSLAKPILPGARSVFEMVFESQVPVQIRRSGRDNAEGIAYSMSQWYPKMCEYDYQGWHANPYIGREFHGVWGDFDVKIRIDGRYILGGSGYLQNADEIGYGYGKTTKKIRHSNKKLTWHFLAPNVHDFVWAADPDYEHLTYERKDGAMLHFLYQPTERNTEQWQKLPKVMDRVFDYANRHFGQYPYKQYSFIQAGDGGMEYPMATLMVGNRSLSGLVSTSIHEVMHSWYQGVLANNESLYAWMDEGFTEYAEGRIKNFLREEGLYPGKVQDNPHRSNYNGYFDLVESGLEEPSTTHSDHFLTNYAYGKSAYRKGAVFLHQLSYIIGQQAFDAGMLRYYNTWKFKHPNPNDFIRIMEKESGLELDWYKEYWINTTHHIDYGISLVEKAGRDSTRVVLERIGRMPMPQDVVVTYSDGSTELFNIPLVIMRGHKKIEQEGMKVTLLKDWPWTNPVYEFSIPSTLDSIKRIELDPSGRMADLNLENNEVIF